MGSLCHLTTLIHFRSTHTNAKMKKSVHFQFFPLPDFFLILFDCFIVVYNIYIFLQSHPLAQTATMTLLLFLVPALIIPALGSFYYYFSLPLPATLFLLVFSRLASSQQSGHAQLKCHPLRNASLTTGPPNIQHITVFNFL